MVFAVAETVAKRDLPTKEIRLLPAKNLGWKIQYVQDGGKMVADLKSVYLDSQLFGNSVQFPLRSLKLQLM